MKLQYKNLLLFYILFLSIKLFGQTDQLNLDSLTKHINFLTASIDKHNPPKKTLSLTKEIDTIVGAKIMTIQSQSYKSLSKYILTTYHAGDGNDIKFIEMYLCNDTLLKVIAFY
ncbi:MAG: hypothetical protein ACOYMA_16335 [Bacteroidia bacterium]